MAMTITPVSIVLPTRLKLNPQQELKNPWIGNRAYRAESVYIYELPGRVIRKVRRLRVRQRGKVQRIINSRELSVVEHIECVGAELNSHALLYREYLLHR